MDTKKYTESEYLTVANVKEGQSKQLVVVSAGIAKPNEKGIERFQCLVEIDGRQKLYRPNTASLKAMQGVWGYESSAWVGKKLNLSFAVFNGKEAIIGTPA